MRQTEVIEVYAEAPGIPCAALCQGEAAMSYRQCVILVLVSLVCVATLWGPGVVRGQTTETGVTIEMVSTPSLEHLRPPTDLARVTLMALLHDKPLLQGHIKVQLMAPLLSPVRKSAKITAEKVNQGHRSGN